MRPINGETALSSRRKATPGGIDAPETVDADRRGARPFDVAVLPPAGQKMRLAGLGDRIMGRSAGLVAVLRPAFVLQPYLPHEIGAEAGQAATLFDPGLDRFAHIEAPVLVMTGNDRAGIRQAALACSAGPSG